MSADGLVELVRCRAVLSLQRRLRRHQDVFWRLAIDQLHRQLRRYL